MPAADAVAGEELPSARARQREHVLGVGERRGHPADDGRVERPSRGGEEEDRGCAAPELEAARMKILMRHAVAGDVGERSERGRAETVVCQRADERARRDVERGDHAGEGAERPAENGARMAAMIVTVPRTKIR